MIENMRGRSTETKYGRIPLWLYGAGVSLQAVATYGWLHGKYGHFDRVVPSYATLAKELGVSRGSVIAYVKELTGAGAVRIATSGQVGQTTNTYEIAFNEPFPVPNVQVSGGQNADQVVSGLYSGGQRADQGGQPAVHEEDVFKKTKKTLSSRIPRQTRKASAATAKDERETPTLPTDRTLTAAQRAVRTTGAVSEADEAAFIDWITRTHKPRGPAWWRTAAPDLPELATDWRAKQTPAAPAVKLRPTGHPCACCGSQAPAACTSNGLPYCANCTAPCQTCQQAVPDDQLHAGQCLTCLPIERRTRAA